MRSLTLAAISLLATLAGAAHAANPTPKPGTLANPRFEGQAMKSTYFFTGEWRLAGATFYEGPVPGEFLTPASNNCLYSVYPVDGGTNLGWSETPVKRDYALNNMLGAGVNVVNMSYWGPPSTDRWAFWAPMQTAPRSHDELFDAAIGKPVLIAPYIEEGAATNYDPATGLPAHQLGCLQPDGTRDSGPTGRSPGFTFADDFPGTADNPAPALVSQILDLVDRYLVHPRNAVWPKKWARMYDRNGEPRYVVSLIHVGSNQVPGVNAREPFDETFAKGFSWVANTVYRRTGIRVGFTLDVLPPENALVRFKPSAKETGKFLAGQPAVLAIEPFISEVHTRRCLPVEGCDLRSDSEALKEMIAWKRDFIASWVTSGIPVILDVSPGRDAHIVFPGPVEPRYGNNDQWRQGQAEMLSLDVRGLTGNTFNGYTEGFAIVPACAFPWDLPSPGIPLCDAPRSPPEDLNRTYEWFKGLVPPGGVRARLPAALTGTSPSGGRYSDAVNLVFTLTRALTGPLQPGETIVPVPDRLVQVRLGKQAAQGRTDANGLVHVSVLIDQQPGAVPVVASFAGDDVSLGDPAYLSIEAPGTFVIERESTVLRGVDAPVLSGRARVLAALLTDDEGTPIRQRTITFVVRPGSGQSCSGVTGTDGIARCTLGVPMPGERTVSMIFAGDAFYEPVTAKKDVLLMR
jgi:hypothetical protein